MLCKIEYVVQAMLRRPYKMKGSWFFERENAVNVTYSYCTVYVHYPSDAWVKADQHLATHEP